MQSTIARIGAVAAFACCLAAFTGTAIAGNGNGNGNDNANGNAAAGNAGTPPGQEKKADQATATAAQPTAQPQPDAQPASQPVATPHGNPNAPGQEKKTASATTGAGVKPSNATSHWTKCSTGGTSASATCSGNGPKADGSKQYGNGNTAAQIAVGRGGTGVVLTGPGNSQPHKVAICPKKTNKSGGVDVHAVKSYSTTKCAKLETATAAKASTPSFTTTTTVTASAQQTSQPISATQSPLTRTPAGSTGGTAAGAALAAEATMKKAPKSGRAGGVLGATAKLGKVAAKGTLPFTGLPLWVLTLAALGLIGTGLALRGRRPVEA